MSSQIKNRCGFTGIEVLVGIVILVGVIGGAWAYNTYKTFKEKAPKSFDVEGQSNTPVAPVPSVETIQSATAPTADEQKAKKWFANCSDLNTCLAQCKEDTDDDLCPAEYQKHSSAKQSGSTLPPGTGAE